MNTQSTVEQMQHLKLFGMSKLYRAVLDQPVHQQPEAHMLLGMLADAETQYRLSQRTQLYLCLSRLRYNTMPEQVDIPVKVSHHSGESEPPGKERILKS